MGRYLSATPPARIFRVIIEAVRQGRPNQASGQVAWNILVEARRRRIGVDLLKPGRNNKGLLVEDLKKDYQKGYYLSFPV